MSVAGASPTAGFATDRFSDVVRVRRSVRRYLDTQVAPELIDSVLDDARWAPSNCNTQPWEVHLVSGAARDRLSAALLAAHDRGERSPDFSFDPHDYAGVHDQRRIEQGIAHLAAIGVERSDAEGRRAALRRNLEFFGAPHVALLFVPSVGDNVRVAADAGMYAQTFLLALTARGLGGIAQTFIGEHAATVKESLALPGDKLLLFGISFGYPAGEEHPMPRAPIAEFVVRHF